MVRLAELKKNIQLKIENNEMNAINIKSAKLVLNPIFYLLITKAICLDICEFYADLVRTN